MPTKSIVAVFMALIFILSLSSSVLASTNSTRYEKWYNLDGDISIKMQAGSDCSASGKHQTQVSGVGSLQRHDLIKMNKAELLSQNEGQWVADPDSLRGLEVASSFWLNDESDFDGPEQVFAISVDADAGEEGYLAQNISSVEATYDQSSLDKGSLEISQDARTSGGKLKRYIDFKDPASSVYVFEDTEIKGFAEIRDEFGTEGNVSEDLQIRQYSISDSEQNDEEGFKEELPGEELSEGGSLEEDTLNTALLVLEGGGMFETEVPLGTSKDELALPQTIEMTTDMFTISGIEINWDADSFPEYDPGREDSYIFAGAIIFPDHIEIQEKMIMFYTVHVTEDMDPDDLNLEVEPEVIELAIEEVENHDHREDEKYEEDKEDEDEDEEGHGE